jgi:WhiB family redox-sensing transcriptional regulator
MNFADLAATLWGAPALPGARCRGRSHLFDPAVADEKSTTVAARHAQALGLCQHCPALDACQAWVHALPLKQRPLGVVAGAVRS